MNLAVIQCSNCSYIGSLISFVKDKIIDKCPICNSNQGNLKPLFFTQQVDIIDSIVDLIIHNFAVLPHENMIQISKIFNLTPIQEDSILRTLTKYGWREIPGGIIFDA